MSDITAPSLSATICTLNCHAGPADASRMSQQDNERAPEEEASGGPREISVPDHGTIYSLFEAETWLSPAVDEGGSGSAGRDVGRPRLPLGVYWADQRSSPEGMPAPGPADIVIDFEGEVIESTQKEGALAVKAREMGVDPETYKQFRAAMESHEADKRLLKGYAAVGILSLPGILVGELLLPALEIEGWLAGGITLGVDVAWESTLRVVEGVEPMTLGDVGLSALGNITPGKGRLPGGGGAPPVPHAPTTSVRHAPAPSVPSASGRRAAGVTDPAPAPRPLPGAASPAPPARGGSGGGAPAPRPLPEAPASPGVGRVPDRPLTQAERQRHLVEMYQRPPGRGADVEGVARTTAGSQRPVQRVTARDAQGNPTEVEFEVPHPEGGRLVIRQRFDADPNSSYAAGRIVELEIPNVNARTRVGRDRTIAQAVKEWLGIGRDLGHTQGLQNRGRDVPYNYEHQSPRYNQQIRNTAEGRVRSYVDTHPDRPVTLSIQRAFTANGSLASERFTLRPVGGGDPVVDVTVDIRGNLTDHIDPSGSTRIGARR